MSRKIRPIKVDFCERRLEAVRFLYNPNLVRLDSLYQSYQKICVLFRLAPSKPWLQKPLHVQRHPLYLLFLFIMILLLVVFDKTFHLTKPSLDSSFYSIYI